MEREVGAGRVGRPGTVSGAGHWLLLFLKLEAELSNTPTMIPRSRAWVWPLLEPGTELTLRAQQGSEMEAVSFLTIMSSHLDTLL